MAGLTRVQGRGSAVISEPHGVLARRVTKASSVVIMVGVLVQAVIAGRFLAGYPSWTDIHMMVGVPLVLSALVLAGIGLVGRRRRREPKAVLLGRLGVFASLLTTGLVGMWAAAGPPDLLMLHIPLAIISMGLAARLAQAATREEGVDPVSVQTTPAA